MELQDENKQNLAEESKSDAPKVIDIHPLSSWKRFIVFFTDLIIAFFVTFFLFNVAGFPIAKAALNLDAKNEELTYLYNHQRDILYEHDLLFYEEGDQTLGQDYYKYKDFEYAKEYTFKQFIKYWIFEDSYNEKYNFVSNYFNDIKHDNNRYLEIYLTGEGNDFFVKDENGVDVHLKTIYKDEFTYLFDNTISPSKVAKEDLLIFKDIIFAKAFGLMIKDIEKNNLSIDRGLSYNETKENIAEYNEYYNNVYIWTSLISFIIATAICYLIIPLCIPSHKTVSMLILRMERVEVEGFKTTKWYNVLLSYVYHILTNLVFLMFIPMLVISFDSIFGLTVLLVLSLISFVFDIASTITLIANSYSRSITDFMSGTIMISSDDLDEVYRQMGYNF